MAVKETFRKFAAKTSSIAGNPWSFIAALIIIIVWGVSGPAFNYSNTWQLFINTGTTIVTLLMVFLIQNTQNRDSRAIHLKLDELLKGNKSASNKLVNIEELPDDVLEKLHDEFRKLQSESGKLGAKISRKKGKKLKIALSRLSKIVEKPLSGEK